VIFRGKFRGIFLGISWGNDFSKLFPRKIPIFPDIFRGKISRRIFPEIFRGKNVQKISQLYTTFSTVKVVWQFSQNGSGYIWATYSQTPQILSIYECLHTK
jgi:hypothetical protein